MADQPVDSITREPSPPPPPAEPSATAAGSATVTHRGPDRRAGISLEAMNQRALVTLLLVLSAGLAYMLKAFFAPVVVAVAFATIFYPLYDILNRTLRGRKHPNIAAFLTCLILLLGLLVPAYIVVDLMARQTVELYGGAETRIREVVSRGSDGPLGQLQTSPAARWLRIDEIDWQKTLQEGAATAGKMGTFVVNKTSKGLFAMVFNVFVIFFTLFYLLRDGERLLARMRYFSPLREHYEETLFNRFTLISRAAIRGTLLIGLIQGSLGALALLVFGVKTWLLWGIVMAVLSIIPFTGAWLVMIPAGIIQLVLGNVTSGVGIIAVCLLLVSTIDNILRPRLVGGQAKMHDLLIFFSTIGGISVFGVWGFVVGPIVAALFVAVLEIYGEEYRSQLTAVQQPSVDTPVPPIT